MKESLSIIGFITFLWLLFSLPSCKGRDTSLYECSITYTVNGNQITEKIDGIELPSDYIPAYCCGNGKIALVGLGRGSYQIYYKDIIKTSQDLAVQSFDYKLIRSYKTSYMDGHELKRKKK